MSRNIGWLGGWALCHEAGHDTAMPARTHDHDTALGRAGRALGAQGVRQAGLGSAQCAGVGVHSGRGRQGRTAGARQQRAGARGARGWAHGVRGARLALAWPRRAWCTGWASLGLMQPVWGSCSQFGF